jgi:hypothetical protein
MLFLLPQANLVLVNLAPPSADHTSPNWPTVRRRGEFMASSRPVSVKRTLIDCEEDQTLRAVLIGMLRGF